MTGGSIGGKRPLRGAALALSLFAFLACHRKHVPVESAPELGYPACGDAGTQAGAPVASGHLRAGPFSQEKNVVERFGLEKTPCGFTFRSRQEWPLAIADVEVHYDEALTPIWAWKRMTIAGSTRADGNADIRRYEMRTGEVFIKHRDAQGVVSMEKLLPERAHAGA